ncbi:50S ribosomal protein L21 [Candidatus Roizmanbacteria bacterium]|nr:50S ribosomal protein L21 [Candidatus Roizmanbacteria bacterium]
MKFAVIQTGGKQYQVTEGELIALPRMKVDAGKQIEFPDVLLLSSDEAVQIGKPYVSGVVVKGEVVSHTKGEKIRVATFRAKSRYRKVKGYRSYLTTVKITAISEKKLKS